MSTGWHPTPDPTRTPAELAAVQAAPPVPAPIPEPAWPASGSRWWIPGSDLNAWLELWADADRLGIEVDPRALTLAEVRALIAALQVWADAQEGT